MPPMVQAPAVFDNTFHQAMNLPAGAFATPAAISALHLVPFNVQVLNGFVYVTYAPRRAFCSSERHPWARSGRGV